VRASAAWRIVKPLVASLWPLVAAVFLVGVSAAVVVRKPELAQARESIDADIGKLRSEVADSKSRDAALEARSAFLEQALRDLRGEVTHHAEVQEGLLVNIARTVGVDDKALTRRNRIHSP
jgi:septal ring factor EnvC (AmiA/AmiB activator)